MQIEALATRVPGRCIDNQEMLDLIAANSGNMSASDVRTYVSTVDKMLRHTGAETRYFRDRAGGETAHGMIVETMTAALAEAALKPDDIDLLIYCGVGKGMLEPANAYIYAGALGMACECFDVVDACMSWVRAAEIAQTFILAGRYDTVMIVNGEFNAFERGFPERLGARSLTDIEWLFPSYTIGEATTATVLKRSPTPWRFRFRSRPELHGLSTIPLPGFEDFVGDSLPQPQQTPNSFVAYGREMFAGARQYMTPMLADVVEASDAPPLVIPHAASRRGYVKAAKGAGLELDRMYLEVYPRYGNLVSASIPMGLNLALEDGSLKRGDPVVLCPASAGMSFAVVQLTF